MPRKKRVLFGSVGFIGSLLALVAGLSFVALGGGSTKDGILPTGWVVLIFSALVFVHLQVLGAASLLSLVLHETPSQAPTSDINEHTS